MKTSLIFIFVFSLGILTLLAEKTPYDAIGDAALNNDPVGTHRISIRGVNKRISVVGHWQKANYLPVCFGAKNTQFGRFYAPRTGKLAAIQLVHLYGYVSCATRRVSSWAYWGCHNYPGLQKMVNVVVTTSSNHILLPPTQFIRFASAKWSAIPGYDSLSTELFLSVVSHPINVIARQEVRLWYGEDLMKTWESDNGGRVCCDVYALYA